MNGNDEKQDVVLTFKATAREIEALKIQFMVSDF